MVQLHRISDSDVRSADGPPLPGETAGTAITKQATALSHHISSRDQTSEERPGDGNGTAHKRV